jgi:predicted nucleic acid-binding Zn ribbon protein
VCPESTGCGCEVIAKVEMEKRDEPFPCPECGQNMQRALVAPGFIIRGYAAKNGYSA